MSKKESPKIANKIKLLEYLSNPDNEILTRAKLSTQVLGYSQEHQIYASLSPAELAEIEREALELRRKCYAASLGRVDNGILRAAAKGDAAAAKLCYQRFEGFSEKTIADIRAAVGGAVSHKWVIEVVRPGDKLDGEYNADDL